MRVGNLQSGSSQLQEAFEKLMAAWDQTRDHWSDERARQFEEEHLRPIAEELNLLVPGIGTMSQVIERMVRECDE